MIGRLPIVSADRVRGAALGKDVARGDAVVPAIAVAPPRHEVREKNGPETTPQYAMYPREEPGQAKAERESDDDRDRENHDLAALSDRSRWHRPGLSQEPNLCPDTGSSSRSRCETRALLADRVVAERAQHGCPFAERRYWINATPACRRAS